MNTFIQLMLIIIFAFIINVCMRFAGIGMGVYLGFLLWFVSLGLFIIVLPAELPTG